MTPKVSFAPLRTNVPERDETPMKTGDYLGTHSALLCADMHRFQSHHSYRSATMGSTFVARRAGR